MKIKKVTTADGSNSLSLVGQNEQYHSKHGALQEAKHVYIESALSYFFESNPSCQKAKVLEVGFGTGLNTLLSWLFVNQFKSELHYTSIEAFPLEWKDVESLNYPELLYIPIEKFQCIHNLSWEVFHQLDSNFRFRKVEIKLEKINFINEFDVVFFDAFGPRTQPELWEKPILQKIHQAMKISGVFVTYSAKGQVRRNLMEVGFRVQKIPGPPGKREMLRATK